MAGVIDNLVFFNSGSTLSSLDTITSELRHFRAHTDSITSLVTHQRKLFTGGVDGLIVVWDLPNHSKIDTASPIKMMAAGAKYLYFVRGSTVHINIIDISTLEIQSQTILKGQISDAVDLQIFPDESSLLILKTYAVLTYNLTTQVVQIFDHSVPLTAIRMHPEQSYFAVGDAGGQIIKFYPNNTKQKLHWHSHKVKTLNFTSDGSYMISGGEEGVLVLWHDSTGNRSFLPRLGSSITDCVISEDNSFYVVKMIDNSVKVLLSADNKIIASYQGLTDPSKILPYNKIFTGLVKYEDLFVLNGIPGYLQFFNPNSMQVVKFDCVKRNPISRAHLNYPNPLQVIQVAFIQNKNIMVTLEASNSPNIAITYLKF